MENCWPVLFSKSGNSKIDPFENQMTLARPPTVLSTHTNDYAISRHRKIVEAKTARENFDADTVNKVTFLNLLQNNEN